MVTIRVMTVEDYEKVYDLWLHTPGMGLNKTDDSRRGFIHHTAVKVTCRRQGIGKRLVDAAMKALEAEGIHKVVLVAFEKNEIGNLAV